MAPKGGKGSSTSYDGYSSSSESSGGVCRYCRYQYQLSEDNYATPAARAILALQVVFAVVVVICMFLVAKRPWLKLDQKKDHYKVIFYMLMGITQLLYLIIASVDSILHQVEVETTYSYYITYIFRSLLWRLSDLFMVAIIFRCLEGARNAMLTKYTKLWIPHLLAILLLALVSLIAWAFSIKDIASILATLSDDDIYAMANTDTAYAAIVFATSFWMVLLVIFIGVKKAIPTSITLLLFITAGSYWLSNLLNVILYSTLYWSTGSYTYSLGAASGIIGLLAAIAIFIALALLSRRSNARTRQLFNKPDYTNLGNQPTELAWEPKHDQHSFSTDTSYQGGGFPNNQWPMSNTNNQHYAPVNTNDPATQPLYPTQTYNPPQQPSNVYDSGPQHTYSQEGPIHQEPQRFYGNNHAYSAVPQAGG